MSRLTDLISQVKSKDSELGIELEKEFKIISSRLSFGLNFERHIPESVQLPGLPVRKGDKVRVLPPRGSTKKGDHRIWKVHGFEQEDGKRAAHIELIGSAEPEEQTVLVEDLVVVAEFRDYIYPGLVSTGKVERGGDKPFHTVINGENYHALEALTFTHRGKIDVIYIDPPYNTGAKDWKYNNDYIEAEDLYRHSKWLAFMERRLLISKELLKTANSLLIVTIDEKEYLRLGLLLEQLFPEAKIQMVSSVINPGGASRNAELTRVNEFLFFVMIGGSVPSKTESDLLFTAHRSKAANRSPIWRGLLRGGSGPFRQDSSLKFFPILVDPITMRVVGAGEPLPLGVARESYMAPDGLVAVWPLKTAGVEGRWELSKSTFEERLALGYVRAGTWNVSNGQYAMYYLRNAEIERIGTGELVNRGMTAAGYLDLDYADGVVRKLYAKTVWNTPSHDAGTHGSSMVKIMLSGRKFPFPKSLYAVEDALRIFVKDNSNAVILDFFAGSGTTAHAVMRLNKQDDGKRQCISVTNNEVAAEEQKALREQCLRPGDIEWEQWGICDYITKPRISAAITGKTPDGNPIKGDYKFTDEFPISEGFEENAEFFTLTYESPIGVSHNHAFTHIAPLLWMRAGSTGRRIEEVPEQGWDVADTYGLLTDLDQAAPFCDAVEARGTIHNAFIVTDDDRRFQSVARRLPNTVEPVRLYESYLINFRFSLGQ